jgi:hypothetical protein
VNNGEATVWVKPNSISSSGSQFILYYNCGVATSISSGASVFSQFEDFEGSTVLPGWTADSGVSITPVLEGSNHVGLFTSNGVSGSGVYKTWTTGSGILEYSIKLPQTTAYHTLSAFSGHASGVKGIWFFAGPSGTFTPATTPYVINQWYSIRLVMKGNAKYDSYINGVKVGSDIPYYGTTPIDRLGIIGWSTGGRASYDNIRMRPYTTIEPGVIQWTT